MIHSDLIKYACNRLGYHEKELSDLIICEVLKALIAELIQFHLIKNTSTDVFFTNDSIYFHKWKNYPDSYFIYYEQERYFFITNNDKGEKGTTIHSKYLNTILFNTLWSIAYSISHYHLPSKPYKEAEERKIEIFLALIEKAGIY